MLAQAFYAVVQRGLIVWTWKTVIIPVFFPRSACLAISICLAALKAFLLLRQETLGNAVALANGEAGTCFTDGS